MVKNYLKLMLAIVLTSQAMAQAIPSNVPKDGLVGWWPFNGNANDESGNGNHGTVNGATLTVDRFGRSNNAYSFDNIINYNEITISAKSLDNLTNAISIFGWFKANELSNFAQILGKRLNNNYAPFSSLAIQKGVSNETWRVQMSTNTTTDFLLSTNSELVDSVWISFCITYDGNSLKYYEDGKLLAKSPLSGNILYNDSPLIFGGSASGIGQSFRGQIDDIAIYNRALSELEIKQLYEGCPRETATLNPTNGVVLKNSNPITLNATPSGGVFKGKAILNGDFTPKNATLGSNSFDYHFVNSQGCKDSTQFKVVVYDTLGTVCSSTDTLKIKFQLTTGIKAGQLTAMNVYPNPTSDVLIIEASDVNALKNYTYRIVNLEGKEVYKNFVTATKTEISLKTLGSKGIYVLHILDENGTSIENKKIVLE